MGPQFDLEVAAHGQGPPDGPLEYDEITEGSHKIPPDQLESFPQLASPAQPRGLRSGCLALTAGLCSFSVEVESVGDGGQQEGEDGGAATAAERHGRHDEQPGQEGVRALHEVELGVVDRKVGRGFVGPLLHSDGILAQDSQLDFTLSSRRKVNPRLMIVKKYN